MDGKNSPVPNSANPVNVAGHPPISEKLHTLWVALVLAALVAAGFGISFLAYPYLVANGPSASVETIGEMWDGAMP